MEHLNWLVYALGKYYFSNEELSKTLVEDLPERSDDIWIKGFTWKGLYIRLYYISSKEYNEVKKQFNAIRQLSLNDNASRSVIAKNYALPMISTAKFGSRSLVVSPCILVNSEWKKNSKKYFEKNKWELPMIESSLFSKLTSNTIIPIQNLPESSIQYLIAQPSLLFESDNFLLKYMYIPANTELDITILNNITETQIQESFLVSILDHPNSKMNGLNTLNSYL